MAHWIDRWLEGVNPALIPSEDWYKGFENALRQVAGHLRKGDLHPGARLYEDAVRRL